MAIFEKEAQWLLKEKYSGVETAEYRADLAALKDGTPLAYLIGHVPFLNTTIYLDSHPLIPRIETEFWVKKTIAEIAQSRGDDPISVLDLCAGSGCIGVSILKALPHARVDFIEIDPAHHPTIEKNLEVNGIPTESTYIVGGDLFQEAIGPYDYILANPPYINPQKADRIEESVRAHEPHLALFGGSGGLEYIERIIKDAQKFLALGGALYIEHEPEQKDAVHAHAAAYGFKIVETHKDQYGVDRVTRLQI